MIRSRGKSNIADVDAEPDVDEDDRNDQLIKEVRHLLPAGSKRKVTIRQRLDGRTEIIVDGVTEIDAALRVALDGAGRRAKKRPSRQG